jgi:hypothetical protein
MGLQYSLGFVRCGARASGVRGWLDRAGDGRREVLVGGGSRGAGSHEHEHPAQLDECLAAAVLDCAEGTAGAVGIRPEQLCSCARLDHDLGGRVRDRVVELGGDPDTLGEHRQALVLGFALRVEWVRSRAVAE